MKSASFGQRDPFKIDGPACVSFSGGRTSGYMLWRILQAHNGKLPDDVVVCFANTGREMPETLDFVHECSERWSVPITWLEYENRSEDPKFRVVTHATASRNGEPFAAAIRHRSRLPSPIIRFCTVEMKILTVARYLWSLGWTEFDVAVGLRADEPRRLANVRANPSGGTRGLTRILPLAQAGVTKEEVGAFWQSGAFDLRLSVSNGKTMHGNCDLCHLKGAAQVLSLIREQPQRAVWWMEQERMMGATFRDDRPSYAEMHRMATQHGELFAFNDDGIEDCACTD